MHWVGRNLQKSFNPTPCSEQGHPSLDHIAQSIVKPSLEYLQGWDFNYLPGQLVWYSTTFTVKDLFLISNLNLPFSNFKPLLLILSPQAFVNSTKCLLVGPLHQLKEARKLPSWKSTLLLLTFFRKWQLNGSCFHLLTITGFFSSLFHNAP